jgi:TPP-dependent trihydroxycyclohexane-1,2-dione (THcHDO) dehydratase
MVSPSGPAATTLPAPNAAAVIGNNEIPLFYVHGDNYADRTEPVAAQTSTNTCCCCSGRTACLRATRRGAGCSAAVPTAR